MSTAPRSTMLINKFASDRAIAQNAAKARAGIVAKSAARKPPRAAPAKPMVKISAPKPNTGLGTLLKSRLNAKNDVKRMAFTSDVVKGSIGASVR